MQKKISLLDVKQALRDGRFREALPKDLASDVQKYLQNPGCACNFPIYQRVLRECRQELKAYFPGKEVADIDEEIKLLSENHWRVISCHIDELEGKLRTLGPGRKQISTARWQDQITVVVNELDILY